MRHGAQNNEVLNDKDTYKIIAVDDEEKASSILKKLVAKNVKIEKFELMKPTLHEIFIEKVGE